MTSDPLHLDLAIRPQASATRWEVTLRRDGGGAPVQLWYELPSGNRRAPQALDGFVFPVLLYAMRLGARLVVHGPLSRTGLCNMAEVQAFWHLWYPEKYLRIDITPESVVDLERRKAGRRALAAFSGGADSCFTVLRHCTRLVGNGSYNLDTAVMVHGFDVKLANQDHFDRLVHRTAPFLAELSVTLETVRTNSKELGLMDWEDSHAAQLAGCLHLLSPDFEFGLVGSTASYDDLHLPWGSNPITDGLLSGDGFAIVHDGAGFSRTDKIAALLHCPTCVASLKVCWEGKDQDRNCGFCEKCIRTRLNFLAAGEANPACFDTPFHAAAIGAVQIRNRIALAELRSIATYAGRHGFKAQWLDRLNDRLRAHEREMRRDLRRRHMIGALDTLGMKEPLKRGLRLLRLAG